MSKLLNFIAVTDISAILDNDACALINKGSEEAYQCLRSF